MTNETDVVDMKLAKSHPLYPIEKIEQYLNSSVEEKQERPNYFPADVEKGLIGNEDDGKGRAIIALWRKDGCVVGADSNYMQIYNSSPIECKQSYYSLLRDYESSRNICIDTDDILSDFPKETDAYQKHFKKNLLLNSKVQRSSSLIIYDVLNILFRYRRSDGTVVALLSNTITDITSEKLSGAHFLRWEHHIGSLTCQINGLREANDFSKLSSAYQDVSDILSIATKINKNFVEEQNLSFDRLHIHDKSKLHRNISRLVSHPETTTTSSILHFDDTIEFFHRVTNETVEFATIRTCFILPVLDIAALHGIGEASIEISSDGVMSIGTCLLMLSSRFSGTVAHIVQGQSLAGRILHCDHILRGFNLTLEWRLNELSNEDSHTDRRQVNIVLANVRTVTNSQACPSAAEEIIPPSTALQKKLMTNKQQSPFQLSAQQDSSMSLETVATNRDDTFPFHSDARLIIVEDQVTLARMIRACAEKYFASISMINTPLEVSVTENTVIQALAEPQIHCVVVLFDENIYSLDHNAQRTALTGTALRDEMLTNDMLQAAHSQHRLLFVGYSTSAIADQRMHLSRRKDITTPRTLLREISVLLDTFSLRRARARATAAAAQVRDKDYSSEDFTLES